MTREAYPDYFNDVFGPVMQPGSSSHTAGPCRLGFLVSCLLGEQPARVQVTLDKDGSFAGTFGIMSEDRAMLAGAMGILPDDVRLFDAQTIAEKAGIAYSFDFLIIQESRHPNAVKFVLTGSSGRMVSLVGDSTGGGMVRTAAVNGYPLQLRGDTYVLLIFDRQNSVSSEDLDRLDRGLGGLVEARVVHAEEAGRLFVFRTAEPPDQALVEPLVSGAPVAVLEPVLPVITRPERRPQLFDTMVKWREIAERESLPLWEVAVEYEVRASGWRREEVIDHMRMLERKMYRQTHAAYEEEVVVPESPFKSDRTAAWERYGKSSVRLTGDMTANTIRWAYGAGAGIPGVETVAGPMGSGGGYVHAALWAVKEAKGLSEDDLLRGLFIAAGIGALAFSRTEPTGECIRCTGECGTCGAMAAGGIAEMAGARPDVVERAASLSLQSSIGLPCDPIPGGFGQPCRSRIMAAVCTASVFADLAFAGHEAVLPLHEAIDVADDVGRQLAADLLCTSRGGSCATPAARRQAAAYRAWFEESAPQDRPPGNLI